MRRALEYVKAFDGVDRAARAGAAAHRGRPDERGRAVRRARPDRLAGGRRGVDHRPRRAARRARRFPPARLPRLDRRDRRRHPLGEGARHRRHRRGDAAPPAAHRGAGRAATTPATRSTRRCAAARTCEALRAGLADGTIDIVATDHAPHPVEAKDCEWDAAAFGMVGLESALSVVQASVVDNGLLDWTDVARVLSATPARDRPSRRATAVRWPRAHPRTSSSTTRRRRARSRPATSPARASTRRTSG